jgi:hypothetical protein
MMMKGTIMTNLQKTNIFNMAVLSIAIVGYAAVNTDPLALVFLAFPAIIALVNWKNL